ncbi:Pro-Pol polyprotein, partial [Zancudomyces culisetae]
MGTRNPADALSRLTDESTTPVKETLDIFTLDFLYFTAITHYLQTYEYPRGADESFRTKLRNKAKKYTLHGDKLCRVIKGQVKEVLHEKNIEETIKLVHEESHLGIENTWIKVKEKYTGEGLYDVVKKVVNECFTCQRYKGGRTKKSLLNPIYSPKPFSIFGLDAVGPINPISESGNRFILTGIDYFTKWPVAAASYGVPSQIITDRGAGFVSDIAEQFYKHLAELLYGVQITTPSVWTPPPDADNVELAIRERIQAITSELPEMRNESVEHNAAAKAKDKATYNRHVKVMTFQKGDLVLKLTEQFQSKLEEIWEGPYRVDNVLSKGTYIITDDEGNRELIHGDMLKRF